jgi:lysozyme family protein
VTSDAEIIAAVVAREGGYVDHSADRGGPTNWGITQRTLSDWRGHEVTASELKGLGEGEALQIYEARYIKEPGFDLIEDDKLRALVVDCAVNSGPFTATTWLQKAVGEKVDGIIGSKTIAALKALPPHAVALRIVAERMRFRGYLISHDPSQAAFAAGWANRDAALLESFA